MAQLIAPSGFLQIYTNETYAGLNYKNLREIYIPAADFSYEEEFTHPLTNKQIKGSWFFDEGYEVMTKEEREPRHYCIKGKASFSFTGTNLIIRLMLDSGQGRADIIIDGKKPSEVGAYGAVDKLDCDLDHYAFGDGATMQYHDVNVAEGLTDGAHTCDILANNKAGVYFLLGGAKIRRYEMDAFNIHGYHARATLPHNQATIRLVNTSKYAVHNLSMNIPTRYINRANGKPFPQPYTVAELAVGEQLPLLLSVDGMGYEDAADLSIGMTADYGMPLREGYPSEMREVTLLPRDKRLEYAGDWMFEELGKEQVLFAHTDTLGDRVAIRTNASRIDMNIEIDWGYHYIWVYVNGKEAAGWSLHAEERAVRTYTVDNLGYEDKLVTFSNQRQGVPSVDFRYDFGFAFVRIILRETVEIVETTGTVQSVKMQEREVILTPDSDRLIYEGDWSFGAVGTKNIHCAHTVKEFAALTLYTNARDIIVECIANWGRTPFIIEIDGKYKETQDTPDAYETETSWGSTVKQRRIQTYEGRRTPAEEPPTVKKIKIYTEKRRAWNIYGFAVEDVKLDENGKNEILPANSTRLVYEGDWRIAPIGKEGVICAQTETEGSSVSFGTTARNVEVRLKKSWTHTYYDASHFVATVNGEPAGKWNCGEHILKLENMPVGNKAINITYKVVPYQQSYTFAFSKVVLHEAISYLKKSERIPIRMTFDYIKPFGIEELTLVKNGAYVSYGTESTDVLRQDDRIPRRNEGAKEVKVMRRYPTFALNYSDKHHENLKYYDLIVVDPGTVTRKEVAAWQKMGIKVFGYVSFGEEDGVLIDPWDVKSGNRPHTDDGKGVGGYASYYNKGGNGYAELNQCLHDGLIETGEKKCLLGDAHYFTGAGCCTRVCRHDSRTGYTTWESGGKCGGGYTKKNHWKRTGDEACTNEKCPKYAPYHGGCPHYTHHDGWGQDLNYTTPDFPDQNGIWGSSYINPLAPRWKEKLSTFYLRRVFGLPKKVTEKVKLRPYTSDLVGTSYIFRSSEYPIDKDEEVHLYSSDGREYRSLAYNFDPTTGAFQVEKEDVEAFGDIDAELTVSYHVVGMGADGVFMDTLDTVDVYPSAAFQQGMARMINELKAEYPHKHFLANRGFTIMKDIIASCSYVMFETFISEYDWETKTYYKLTDPATIAYNEEIKEQLRELRREHVFEVLALNYCADGAEGDELREVIAQECYAEGYMSWSANILLDDVLPPYLVKSDAWKNHIKPGNPFFGDVPAVDSGWVVRVQNEVEICSDYAESNRIWQRLPEVERDDWYEVLRFPVVGGYLEREVTTLAWCWRLELTDGRVMGFTSCDIDLLIDGETYESCTGFAPTAVSASNDLATDNLDVDGIVSSDRITEEDIFLGVYDNAKIRIFICDYEHPENHFILREGMVGKLTAGKTAFKAEIRGLMDVYQQQVGRTYQRKCRAQLGDGACKYDIGRDTVTGKVTAVRDDGSVFTDVFRADDFFTYGVITFTSGLNKGAAYEVEQSASRNGQIRLFAPPTHEVVVGDTFRIVPGCNGEPSTCKKRFHNFINFRGEPYIPGNDYAVGYPIKAGGNIVPEGQSVRLRSFEFQT